MTQEELHEANIKIPQAIGYLVDINTRLLEHIANLEYERDEYQKKYTNSEELRRISNDNSVSTSD